MLNTKPVHKIPNLVKILFVVIVLTLMYVYSHTADSQEAGKSGVTKPFTLSSKEFQNGDYLPPEHAYTGFDCHGENLSPSLIWENPPLNTRGFALTVYNPDAPSGSGWWHWMLVNVSPSVLHLNVNDGSRTGVGIPLGASHIRNDYGYFGYGGPCPQIGAQPQRLFFSIHALDVPKIDVDANTVSPALVGLFIKAHTIQKTSLLALYKR